MEKCCCCCYCYYYYYVCNGSGPDTSRDVTLVRELFHLENVHRCKMIIAIVLRLPFQLLYPVSSYFIFRYVASV